MSEPLLLIPLSCVVSPQVVSTLSHRLVGGVLGFIHTQLCRVEVATEVEPLHTVSVVSHICEAEDGFREAVLDFLERVSV